MSLLRVIYIPGLLGAFALGGSSTAGGHPPELGTEPRRAPAPSPARSRRGGVGGSPAAAVRRGREGVSSAHRPRDLLDGPPDGRCRASPTTVGGARGARTASRRHWRCGDAAGNRSWAAVAVALSQSRGCASPREPGVERIRGAAHHGALLQSMSMRALSTATEHALYNTFRDVCVGSQY